MIDRDVLLEALSTVCNANVTLQSDVRLGSEGLLQLFGKILFPAFLGADDTRPRSAGATQQPQLFSKNFIHAVLNADKTSQVSRSNFDPIRYAPPGPDPSADCTYQEGSRTRHPPCFINEDEFFDQRFDYDFTNLTDVETYHRGGEVYERPCGWQRFAIRVLDNYEDNAWLGTRYRSTESVPGEWPVSYHGTTKEAAKGIVEGKYEPRKPAHGKRFGRGIYSTPYLSFANKYVQTFTCKKDGKTYKVMLQNRVNPEYRKIYNEEKEWLVPIPEGTSQEEEQKMVQRAIRPYGLLLKEA